jgi:hypothetical protein
MGHVRLKRTRSDVFFVVEMLEPGHFMSGELLDRWNLATAVSLVPGAAMSEPEVVEDMAGLSTATVRSRLSCSAENATALVAAGFTMDEPAASKVQQYEIPHETTDWVRQETRRLIAEFHQQISAEVEGPPPVPPWVKTPPPAKPIARADLHDTVQQLMLKYPRTVGVIFALLGASVFYSGILRPIQQAQARTPEIRISMMAGTVGLLLVVFGLNYLAFGEYFARIFHSGKPESKSLGLIVGLVFAVIGLAIFVALRTHLHSQGYVLR